jgi:hypothetical protein
MLSKRAVKKSLSMPEMRQSPKPPTADEIAELTDRGEDISRFFTRKCRMMPPILPLTEEEGNRQED